MFSKYNLWILTSFSSKNIKTILEKDVKMLDKVYDICETSYLLGMIEKDTDIPVALRVKWTVIVLKQKRGVIMNIIIYLYLYNVITILKLWIGRLSIHF